MLTEKITQNQFAVMVEMLFTLLQTGLIARAEADQTARRIASQNELTFIYLW